MEQQCIFISIPEITNENVIAQFKEHGCHLVPGGIHFPPGTTRTHQLSIQFGDIYEIVLPDGWTLAEQRGKQGSSLWIAAH